MTLPARAPSRVVALLPAWNAAGFIAPVLDAWAAQTHPALQLLISVDRSDDDTVGLCERFAAARPNVRVVRQPARLGWTGNVNALLRAVDGDLACFAAHDDTPDPCFVSALADALAKQPQAVLAYSDVATSAGALVFPDPAGSDARLARLRQLLRREAGWYVPYRGLFRVDAVRRLRGMRRHLAGEYMADWPWLVRLATLGTFVRVPQTLLHKSLRAGSLSQSWRRGPGPEVAVIAASLIEVARSELPPRCKSTLLREALVHEGVKAWAWVQRRVLGALRS